VGFGLVSGIGRWWRDLPISGDSSDGDFEVKGCCGNDWMICAEKNSTG
jgi:hypothetical protein